MTGLIETITENKKAMAAILLISIIMFVMGFSFLEYTWHTRQKIVSDCNEFWKSQVKRNCMSETTALSQVVNFNWSKT